jgi:cell wall-associated NlpC family hydrolase
MALHSSKARLAVRATSALVLLASLCGIGVAMAARPAGATTQQQAIVDFAASQAGTPYCEGGGGIDGPTVGNASSTCGPGVKGYDCMSLAQYAVYQATRIRLPGNGTTQAGTGTFIPPAGDGTWQSDVATLAPGDVVYFGGTIGNYHHSGVYAGNGQIWDALEAGTPVEEHPFSALFSDYGNVYDGAYQYWTAGTVATPPTKSYPPGPGYNLVGSDGGVFVFGGGYYGSLPGLGVHVDDVTGMVGTAKDNGYFLVGEDGGVFAFHAPFANSLPGIGVHVDDIVGIVPTLDDRGYFLVGRDGGVFSFNAPFENSLPGVGVSVDDIVGIAATSDDKGYWLVGSNGDVYAFGDAHYSGNAPVGAVGITATHDGGGYWVVGADGSVSAFGDAGNYGDLPVLGVSVDDIVGIVVSHDSAGYNLIGSDGGVFSFGDAVNKGSLPGLGVSVDDIVGAVPN